MKNEKKNISPIQLTVIGALSGAMAALASQPFSGLKKRSQSGQRINAKCFFPRELYRGTLPTSAKLIPTTMLQIMLDASLRNYLPEGRQNQMISATFGGAFGAVVSTAAEHTMLKQQLNQVGPYSAFAGLLKTGWTQPWRGLKCITIREAIFGSSTLYFAEAAGNHLSQRYNTNMHMWGYLCVALVGSMLSHPFDTIATKQQCTNQSKPIVEIAKNIFHAQGTKGFFKGYGYRLVLFGTAMTSIAKTKEYLIDKIEADTESTNLSTHTT